MSKSHLKCKYWDSFETFTLNDQRRRKEEKRTLKAKSTHQVCIFSPNINIYFLRAFSKCQPKISSLDSESQDMLFPSWVSVDTKGSAGYIIWSPQTSASFHSHDYKNLTLKSWCWCTRIKCSSPSNFVNSMEWAGGKKHNKMYFCYKQLINILNSHSFYPMTQKHYFY